MSQIAAIFEKVKESFNVSVSGNGANDEHAVIFAPFSMGFTESDFLFLDTDSAGGDKAGKYYTELHEFSTIANTIPENDTFWTVSAQNEDYLYTRYRNLVQRLKLLDTDTLTIEHLYPAAIFQKALTVVSPDQDSPYMQYYHLFRRLSDELTTLKKTQSPASSAASLEIKLKEEALGKTLQEWKEKGDKQLIDTKILQLIKDEFESFLLAFNEIRGKVLESSSFVRSQSGNGVEFYLTSCSPNNLYQSDRLSWKKITISKQELEELQKSGQIEKYKEILGSADADKLNIKEITFDLLFAHVVRGWFEESLLRSPFWDCMVLDKETIEIPSFTTSLIFIRNVEITLEESAGKSEQAAKPEISNFGPFIMSKVQLQQGNKFRLHSINKSLKIDRGAVLDVIAKIPKKQKIRKVKPSKIIQKKQLQFLRLAPRLKKATLQKAAFKKVPVPKAKFQAKAVLATGIIRPLVLEKKEEAPAENSVPVNELQLIGVVAQKVNPYPNPIAGADYL